MLNDDYLIAKIKEMDDEFQQLRGKPAFGYVSAPTETSERITFQDGTVKLKMVDAYAYMTELLELARTNPDKLPWPLNETGQA